jgi:hypothetical protein
MRSIASALPANDPARKALAGSARLHASDALAHVGSGDYAGEHWLASFFIYSQRLRLEKQHVRSLRSVQLT